MSELTGSQETRVSWKISPSRARTLSAKDVSKLFQGNTNAEPTSPYDPVGKLWNRITASHSTGQRSVSLPCPLESKTPTKSTRPFILKRKRSSGKGSDELGTDGDEDDIPSSTINRKLNRVSSLLSVLRAKLDRDSNAHEREHSGSPKASKLKKSFSEPYGTEATSSSSSYETQLIDVDATVLPAPVQNDAEDAVSVASESTVADETELQLDENDIQQLDNIEKHWISTQTALTQGSASNVNTEELKPTFDYSSEPSGDDIDWDEEAIQAIMTQTEAQFLSSAAQ
ncbi:hypothetical protein SJAG_04239 [Schizosaccharomyces japonicus yFS275]|uniref:Uncharacterized protein n=1 Tax=Schizosaccharomyces japonicus (strain yFS275 / FY16936) TaxID=402676 RepID=B6K6B1_SCHJY|nr:hypothetical protein SJAG_04239 [Schizosaccharomyces japonicus yFS275]EEB09065.1 hypothetical protein SJAG_04239 [Schizosaccharomyces japonicus yFS275]